MHSNFHHSGVLIYRQTRLKNRRSAENFDKSLKCEVETTAYRSFTLEQSRCAASIELYILCKTLSKEMFRLLKYKTEVNLVYFYNILQSHLEFHHLLKLYLIFLFKNKKKIQNLLLK